MKNFTTFGIMKGYINKKVYPQKKLPESSLSHLKRWLHACIHICNSKINLMASGGQW